MINVYSPRTGSINYTQYAPRNDGSPGEGLRSMKAVADDTMDEDDEEEPELNQNNSRQMMIPSIQGSVRSRKRSECDLRRDNK